VTLALPVPPVVAVPPVPQALAALPDHAAPLAQREVPVPTELMVPRVLVVSVVLRDIPVHVVVRAQRVRPVETV
jgi:hypothetical protein